MLPYREIFFNREKMPRNFASKGFTAKLFPCNCKVGVRRPFTSTSVECCLAIMHAWVVGHTVAVLRVLCAIRTFRSAHVDVYYYSILKDFSASK